MTIPTASDFPDAFDTDTNLFLVHDSLRLRLTEDYVPGDTSITTEGDALIMDRMPPTGLITLTEQCSDIDERAISFYYAAFDPATGIFSGLERLPEFADVAKPKRITNVTVNVMARHHNHAVAALKAIQGFCGIEGTVDNAPFGDTLEGRVNFVRSVALVPKAWFTSDQRIGNVPLEVEFNNLSFRLATDGQDEDVVVEWDFGDQTTSVISVISATSQVPDDQVDVLVRDIDSGKIKKIYHQPGLYTVKLTVTNRFGSDVCEFQNYVNARVKAPNVAVIRYIEDAATQQATPGVPPDGPFVTVPKIRSPINTLIQIEVPEGENPATPDYSYAGEPLESGDPIDPVATWTWVLGDDLLHSNNRTTKAAYSVGGIYDLKLRVDTEFGAYRITTYEDSIDIVENQNLWLWVHTGASTVRAYEYGLISETFKLTPAASLTLNRDDSFLDGVANEEQQKREFRKNTGFAPLGSISSGQGGTGLIYYATGRSDVDPPSAEEINVVEFDGFTGTYTNRPALTRQWNWVNLNSTTSSYFFLGTSPTYSPDTSFTNLSKQTLNLATLSVSSTTLTESNLLNGASELTQDVAIYDGDGDPIHGHFSVLRGAWLGTTGYIARNDGVGTFFRIKSFYRTEGSVSVPFINVRKLQDIQGPTKLEGELVGLSSGIYFLNNSGSISKFLPTEAIWQTGGPGVNSLLYRQLQDTSVAGFDDQANTLLAAGDRDKRAYLSFDYSEKAFIKFSEIDITFTSLGSRPEGDQFLMAIF